MTDLESVRYELCDNASCFHFIEANDVQDDEGIAEYVHLDDGEKEHDHDAMPSGAVLELQDWRKVAPYLFTLYDDDRIGPNSEHFTAPLFMGSFDDYTELLGD